MNGTSGYIAGIDLFIKTLLRGKGEGSGGRGFEVFGELFGVDSGVRFVSVLLERCLVGCEIWAL